MVQKVVTPCQLPGLPVVHSSHAHHQRPIFGNYWSRHRSAPYIGTGLTGIGLRTMLGSGIVSARDPFRTTKTAACPLQGNSIGLGYRLDFLVAGMVLVEVKAIDALLPIHQAQLLSYLKLGRWRLGLLINFHVPLLREGIKRVVLGLDGSMETSPVKMVNSLPLCGEYFGCGYAALRSCARIG